MLSGANHVGDPYVTYSAVHTLPSLAEGCSFANKSLRNLDIHVEHQASSAVLNRNLNLQMYLSILTVVQSFSQMLPNEFQPDLTDTYLFYALS